MDISKIKLGSTTYNIKDATARAAASIKYTTIDANVTDINANAATQIATLNANALLKTQQSLTSSEKAQVLTNLGIASARNITVSTSEPTSSNGNDGDIWFVYEV